MPLIGNNYYRVKVNRIQQADEYSTIQVVNYTATSIHSNNNNNFSIKIFNNLLTEGSNQLFIQTATNKNITGRVLLFDILGNVYINQIQEIHPAENYFYLPIANLSHGKYFVVFNYNNEIIKLDFMIVDND
jgi:hypothetical protein